ncbi:MAG: HAD hydrolase-like protein [Candidatus Thermoplasmatota archaeon]|nr:HAD hydrolase-like protein [Candidatus Thermoplasmatota archaeon]
MTDKTYAIIFDLDGVLLDSETDMSWMKQALIDTLNEFGIQPTKKNLEILDRKNLEKFPSVATYFNLNVKELWHVRNYHYTARKVEAIKTKQIHPFPDITAIESLQRDAELAILSNSPQEVVDEFLKMFNLQHLFTAGVGRSSDYKDIFRLKPHPLLWKKLKPDLTATTFLYVGDRRSDRIFAEKMNMIFFGLNRYYTAFPDGFSTLYEISTEIKKKIE